MMAAKRRNSLKAILGFGGAKAARWASDTLPLFVSLILEADDYGRQPCDVNELVSIFFGVPGIDAPHVEAMLKRLEVDEVVFRYQYHRETYLQITNWSKHQRVCHPSKFHYPCP